MSKNSQVEIIGGGGIFCLISQVEIIGGVIFLPHRICAASVYLEIIGGGGIFWQFCEVQCRYVDAKNLSKREIFD